TGKRTRGRRIGTVVFTRSYRRCEELSSLKQRKLADLRAELFRMQALKSNKTDRPQETIEQVERLDQRRVICMLITVFIETYPEDDH
ncbi:hypothetical protein BJV82DRAFT_611842, partial [Fennellomyces sp. T-0311]